MTAPDLKPCPFCGGCDFIIRNGPIEDDWCAVLCEKCYAQGPINYTDPHAKSAWNRRADLAAVAASETPDPAVKADSCQSVRVKSLVWVSTGENRYFAKSADYKVVTDGKGWAFGPEDWPPFYGYPYLTANDAKAAAQRDYETRILSAIETQPISKSDDLYDPAAIREAALREAIALPKYAPTNYGAMSPAERGCWVHTGEIFALIEKGAADGLV